MNNAAFFSHLVLLLAAVYCITKDALGAPDQIKFVQGMYIVFLTNGLLGVFTMMSDSNNQADKAFEFTNFLKKVAPLPLATTEIWLQFGVVSPEAAYCHSAIAGFVILLHIAKEARNDIMDPLVTVCIISLSVVSYLNVNYFALGAATSYGLGYSIYRDGRTVAKVDSNDCFNYLCAATAVLMLKANTGSF